MDGNMHYNYSSQAFGDYPMLNFNRLNTLPINQPPRNELMNPMQVPQLPVPNDFAAPMMYYYNPGIQQDEMARGPAPNPAMLQQTSNRNGYQEGYMSYGYGNWHTNEPNTRYSANRCQRLNQAVVKVTRINKETTWKDFKNLVRIWGPTFKIHLAMERGTNQGRGYGFVHYKHRSDAGRAIEGMNGLSFDNAVLEAEWARQSLNPEQI
ncbi:eukaryotic translation initiation factor 3 subunit G-like [Aethina tumida]|uniref:eukaryotic translation initiation factor 3 subunit G-like n=1 Tax=Aethina tumida TaxID=116153 RepID=UPI00096B642F|nr:eukaryotic translation initiation factor 3 subunit G-like [Aethina tumida]